MWGIIPAAGNGTRIQPLAFSKELLPVGSRFDGDTERPRAVSEYLIERMLQGGADKLCFVISRWKFDILQYYGGEIGNNEPGGNKTGGNKTGGGKTGGDKIGRAAIAYAVQPEPRGLCDAIFRAVPFVDPAETVLVGLPDTIWFPEDAFTRLPGDRLAFLTFPVARPELFDAVVSDPDGRVREIQVKRQGAGSNWVWGAFGMPGAVLHELHDLWRARGEEDEYFGTLVNAWLARGGEAVAVPEGSAYVDVGTLGGYREAMRLLAEVAQSPQARRIAPLKPRAGRV